MRKKVLATFFVFLFVVGICSISVAKTIDLSYNTAFPATHPEFKAFEAWAKDIEKKTNGQVKITLFPGGVLSPPDAIYDSVTKGASDMGTAVLGYSRGKFPVMSILEYPLGFPSARVANKAANEFYKKVRPKELEDVKVLACKSNSPAVVQTKNKPVRTLEDMKGLKIRGMGLSAETVKALGGVPVALPLGEIFEALQRGMIDGVMGSMEGLKSFKAAEITKYTTESYCISNVLGSAVVMNLKKWNSLPKDVQAVFEKATEEWVYALADTWDESDKAGRAFGLTLKNEFITLSPAEQAKWKKAVQPVFDHYIADTKAKGLPGKEYIDLMRKLIEEQTKAAEKSR